MRTNSDHGLVRPSVSISCARRADRIGRPARSAGARRRADGELRAGRDARVPGRFERSSGTRTSAVPAGGSEKTGLAKSPKRRRRTSTGARPGTDQPRRRELEVDAGRPGGPDAHARSRGPQGWAWTSATRTPAGGAARAGWRHADRSGSHCERTECVESASWRCRCRELRLEPRPWPQAGVSRTCRSARSRPPPSAEVPT